VIEDRQALLGERDRLEDSIQSLQEAKERLGWLSHRAQRKLTKMRKRLKRVYFLLRSP